MTEHKLGNTTMDHTITLDQTLQDLLNKKLHHLQLHKTHYTLMFYSMILNQLRITELKLVMIDLKLGHTMMDHMITSDQTLQDLLKKKLLLLQLHKILSTQMFCSTILNQPKITEPKHHTIEHKPGNTMMDHTTISAQILLVYEMLQSQLVID